jgi:hypothetical protein
MATETTEQPAGADEYEELFPGWVYSIPGLLLIAIGFGGIVYLSVL